QYDFGTPEYTNDGLIVFDVGTNEKMPKRICEMVYDNMKDMAFQIDINAVRADSNDACGDDNEMTFYFEGGIGATCDPACPEGQYCDNGICFKGGVPEGTSLVGKACTTTADCNVGWTGTCAVCSSGYNDNSCLFSYYNRKSCTLNDGTPGLCNEGQCIPKGCTSNADCTEPGTYCASTNSSTEMRFQAGETGSCVPVNFIRKETNKETYYISNDLISWWDAEYACAAIGQNIKLLNIDELISDWDGELGYYSKTQLAEELYNIIGGYTIWTQNLAGNSAFVVDLMDGSVYRDSLNYSQRNIGSPIAVCRSY
ncbi:MAG: hypothetical protein IKY98_03760, partial [Alphaproteobacteria bacterium]|nr:hypothetical protein [Alphaproteobacteria bacterium]